MPTHRDRHATHPPCSAVQSHSTRPRVLLLLHLLQRSCFRLRGRPWTLEDGEQSPGLLASSLSASTPTNSSAPGSTLRRTRREPPARRSARTSRTRSAFSRSACCVSADSASSSAVCCDASSTATSSVLIAATCGKISSNRRRPCSVSLTQARRWSPGCGSRSTSPLAVSVPIARLVRGRSRCAASASAEGDSASHAASIASNRHSRRAMP
jgi:hypothetical protein